MLSVSSHTFWKLPKALEALQTALKLMGNASMHINRERRKNALGNMNHALKDLAEDKTLTREPPPLPPATTTTNTLQNGERYPEDREVDDQNRSEGCILHDSNSNQSKTAYRQRRRSLPRLQDH